MSRLFKSLVLGVLLFGFGQIAFGKNNIVTVETSGTGSTQQRSVAEALAEAVRQVNGTEVNADTYLWSETLSGMASDSKGETENFSLRYERDSTISLGGKGQVANYRVLDQQSTALGWKSRVRVGVYKYESPTVKTNRNRLVVLPVRSASRNFYLLGDVSGEQLSHSLTSALEAEFVSSRRFDVLDREDMKATNEELALIASDSASISEKAKIGRRLGSDYLVISEILEASADVVERTKRVTGQKSSQFYGEAKIRLRIVIPATGRVTFSEIVGINLLQHEVAGPSTVDVVNAFAHKVTGKVIDIIYPLRVVAISGEEIVLNQGGVSVQKGEILLLYKEGQRIVDPYNNEKLGNIETEVGVIEIIRTQSKMSFARLLEGNDADIKIGLLARRSEGVSVDNRPPLAPPEPRTEGVRLPQDRE